MFPHDCVSSLLVLRYIAKLREYVCQCGQFASSYSDFFPAIYFPSLLSSSLFAADFFLPLHSQFASSSTLYSYLAVPPTVKAVNQLVGAPVESHVLLECIVEVFPKPLNGWYRNDGKLLYKSFVISLLSIGRPVVVISIFFSSLDLSFAN